MQGKAPGFASETARTVRRGLTTVWELLVVSLPRMLHACAAMSAAEWRVWGSTSWGHFKEEMVHYWIGFKLLCAEVLIASRLSYQALQVWCPLLCLPRPPRPSSVPDADTRVCGVGCAQGRELSRRERKQLVRTTNDLMRMVPFALFIVIPFMELMLPLALKLFPNMLPSTFQDKLKKEEEMRQRVQVRRTRSVSLYSQRVGRLRGRFGDV
jgi:LETM1 and EF-hand domain-containing protein 1